VASTDFQKERFLHCQRTGILDEISPVETPRVRSPAIALLMVLGTLLSPIPAQALELALRGSALQLPLEGYRRAAGSLQLGFGGGKTGYWILEAGSTVPFRVSNYTQTVYFGSLAHEWTPGAGRFFRPLVGFGIGAFADRVSDSATGRNSIGWMPSISTRAGFRIGEKLGLHALFECQAGVYDLGQLSSWIIWPMTRLSGGLHVSF
jgi:hypothetical protein